MKDNTYKTLLLTLLVALFLFLLHFLPTFKIGDAKLREIDILSDLAQKEEKYLKTSYLPPKETFCYCLLMIKDGKVIDF